MSYISHVKIDDVIYDIKDNEAREKLDEKEELIIKSVSGHIAHLEDATESNAINVKVNIEPIQDLHGYESPWLGGSGKNLLKNNCADEGTINGITWSKNSDGSINLSGTASATTSINLNDNNNPQLISSGNINLVCSALANYNPNIEGLIFQNDIYVNGKYVKTIQNSGPTFNYSGTEISVGTSRIYIAPNTVIPNGTIFYPAIEIGTTISENWTPYENNCPIKGFTNCNIIKTKENIWDEIWERGGLSSVNGSNTSESTRIRSKNFIPVNPETIYYFIISEGTVGLRFFDKNKTYIKSQAISGSTQFITPVNCFYIRFTLINTTEYANNICISPYTLTEYKPYNEAVYSTLWQSKIGTIYGGSLNVTTGILTVNKISVDLGTLTWEYSNSNTDGSYRFLTRDLVSVIKGTGSNSVIGNLLCSSYTTLTANGTYRRNQGICIDASNLIQIYDPKYETSSIQEFTNAISGVQLVYELNEPIIYQLTPIEIKFITGLNSIYSDIGIINIDYFTENSNKLAEYLSNKVSFNEIKTILNDKANVITKNITDNTISIIDGSPNPVVDLTVNIEPVQSGTGDPSPTNIRPISGWTGANIFRAGKNLLDTAFYDGDRSTYGVTYKINNNGSITVTGTATTTENAYYRLIANWQQIKNTCFQGLGGKTITISGLKDNVYADIEYRNSNNENISGGTGWVYSGSTILPSDESYKIYFNLRVAKGKTVNTTVFPHVELGTTATSSIYSITFPTEAGTVYGGSLNVTTGVLTVTTVSQTVTSCIATVGTATESKRANLIQNVKPFLTTTVPATTLKTSYLPVVSHSALYNDEVTGAEVSSGGSIMIKILGFSTKTEYDTYLSANPLQLVYELAEPITYQLTPTEVTTLLGENTILADTGAVTVTYRADTKLYIDNIEKSKNKLETDIQTMITQSSENDMIATKIYNKGDWFIINNQLLRAEDTILIGNPIITEAPGNNALKIDLESIIGEKLDLHGTADLSSAVAPILLNENEDLNNLCPENTTWYYTASSMNILNKPFSGGTGFSMMVYRTAGQTRYQIVTHVSGKLYSRYYRNSTWSQWVEWNLEIEETLSGGTVFFNNGSSSSIINLTTTIDPIQLGSGDPSPSNVRLIPGWTDCSITRVGKNLLPKATESSTISGVNFTVNQDGSVSATGTPTANMYKKLYGGYYKDKVPVPKWLEVGKQYYISSGISNPSFKTRVEIDFYDEEGNGTTFNDTNFTVLDTYKYVGVFIKVTASAGEINETFYPQIEIGNFATAYQPYNNTTYIISFKDVVYGGNLDVTTGTLTVTHGVQNLSDLTWSMTSGTLNEFKSSKIANIKEPTGQSDVTNSFCEIFKITKYSGRTDGNMAIIYSASSYHGQLWVKSSITNLTDFNATIANKKIVYELAEPIVYQLTPTKITTLLGNNAVWSETGNITINYFTENSEKLAKYLTNNFDTITNRANAVTITTSGAVATFSDGSANPAVDLTVGIEPVQSGSGDPYPADGGINHMSQITPGTYTGGGITVTVDEKNLVTVKGTKNTNDEVKILMTYVTSGTSCVVGDKFHLRNTFGDANDTVRFYLNRYDSTVGYLKFTDTNRIISSNQAITFESCYLCFSNTMPSGTALNFTFQLSLEYTDAVTDWTPYANIRPITGWTKTTIMGTGKNILTRVRNTDIIHNGISYTMLDGGKILVNGSAKTADSYCSYSYTSVNNAMDATPYKGHKLRAGISPANSGISLCVAYYKADGTVSNTLIDTESIAYFIVPEEAVKFRILLKVNKDIPISNVVVLPTLTDTSDLYNTYPIIFPTEVFNGNLDVTTGILTTTMATKTVMETTGMSSMAPVAIIGYAKKAKDNTIPENILSSYLPTFSRSELYDNDIYGIGVTTAGAIVIRIPGCTTQADYNAYLATNPLQVVYELETPQTYQLTPVEVMTLLGDNTISADIGDINITYKADTKTYIDENNNEKQDILTFDTTPTANSINPVTSGGIKTALDTKQNTLTFDTIPTANSIKPVTSGGIKTALDNKNNYGYCETAAATAEKEVQINGFELITGVTIHVKFKEANSATSPTLNVSNTGAKPIYRYGTTVPSTGTTTNGWPAGAVLTLTYDGNAWIEHFWYNNTYTVYGAYCTTGAAIAEKAATCIYYILQKGYLEITMRYTNTFVGAITLNIQGKGAKPIWINGQPSSEINYTLPGGVYIIYYDDENYYFDTTGKLPHNIIVPTDKVTMQWNESDESLDFIFA